MEHWQRPRFQDLDKKSTDDLLAIIARLRAECEEKVQDCNKLQEEVRATQHDINETKDVHASNCADYTNAQTVYPPVQYTFPTSKCMEVVPDKLKNIEETKEEQEKKRTFLKEEIRRLEAGYKRLHVNHSALLENLANVKSLVSIAAKKVSHAPRPLSRREADEHLDDLVKQYLPERLFKTRRRRDNQ